MSALLPRRLLLACLMAVIAGGVGTAAASALTARATPQKITAAGVGAVKLGKTYTSLRAAGRVGKIGPGCDLGGPGARSSVLRPPLNGSVDYTSKAPRRVRVIAIRGGATARGVGIGATVAAIKRAFPRATIDRRTEKVFGITLVKVPKGGGGRLQFAVATRTKKVVSIGIPFVAICD
jgi:hypothetical protein